jgi:putative ABC transport system permease protein
MGKLLFRGFAQRKVRVLLTGIAIALGVALMAGTYILTDTINGAFSEIFSNAYKNKAVVVTQKETLGRGTAAEAASLNEATLARVRSVSGVAAASGAVSSNASLLTRSGKHLTTGHAPGLVNALQPKRFEAFTAAQGHLPEADDEVALDEATAKRNKLELGEKVVIAGNAPAHTYTLVGIAKFAGSESFGGASLALLLPKEAQYVAGEPGAYDSIYAAADPDVSPQQLAARVRAVLPHTLTVRTGAQEAANQTAELEEKLGFLRTFLLVFAYVALFVGAFIIFNTFSITVAQRTREFGLLRTLGASRAQIMRSVVQEGLLLGVVGAVLGLFGGIGIAPALDGLFKAIGADLPDNGTVLEARTVIVSLAVGILVTVFAGLAPAVRSMRVPPIAAMREGVTIPPWLPTRRMLILRFVIGLIVVLALGALLGHGIGLILVIVWVARAARLFVRLRREGERPPRRYRVVPALANAIGVLVSWRGITGRLARENSVRQPGRTLVTALALMIGIALVTFIAVLAAGTKATIDQAVSRSFAGNLIIQNTKAGEGGVPAVVAPAVRRVPGVGAVTAVAFTDGRVSDLSKPGSPVIDEKSAVTALEPSSFVGMYKVEWKHGSRATLESLGPEGTVISEKFASAHHLQVGQRLSVLTPSNHQVTLKVMGIVKEEVLGLMANITIVRSLARTAFGQRTDGVDFITYASGANTTEVRHGINALLHSEFPQARSQTPAEYTKEQSEKVNTLLVLVYVLLALSVIVSLFGIVNTLVLSIYERTRELGMMRAIGTSRSQIRQMIRYESLITALIGGILGLVVGLIGAILVTELALSGSGYVLSIPVGTLITLLIAAGIAGLLAALAPARRAARLEILGALASE